MPADETESYAMVYLPRRETVRTPDRIGDVIFGMETAASKLRLARSPTADGR